MATLITISKEKIFILSTDIAEVCIARDWLPIYINALWLAGLYDQSWIIGLRCVMILDIKVRLARPKSRNR